MHSSKKGTLLNRKGWMGMAKVLCILRHRVVQLKLAYSWARPPVLVAGKSRGGMFLFLHSFLILFLPFPSFSSPPLTLLSLFSLSLGDDTKWPTRVDVSLNPNTINFSTEKNWYFSCLQKHLMGTNRDASDTYPHFVSWRKRKLSGLIIVEVIRKW